MATHLIAVTDTVFPDLNPAKNVLREIDAEVRLADAPTAEGILRAAENADAVLTTYAKMTQEIIGRLRKCRIIVRFGVGVDSVDLRAASEKGILVSRVPDYCVDEVSDHAIALLLSMARKIPLLDRKTREGVWDMRAAVPCHRIRGLTLGLIGFGRIPQAVAGKASAFGLNVTAYDPYVSDDVMRRHGVERKDLPDLLHAADFVSIHAPLNKETHHLFDRAAFQKMKRGSFLVNTARGGLVDSEALVEALDAGILAGAALDVVETEPPPRDSRLLGRADVVLTPHTGFYSVESMTELQEKAAREVLLCLKGETPKNLVKYQPA